MENSRIELRGIVLPVQMGGLLGGGQRVCWPPLSNYWGGLAPLALPLPTPMNMDTAVSIYVRLAKGKYFIRCKTH